MESWKIEIGTGRRRSRRRRRKVWSMRRDKFEGLIHLTGNYRETERGVRSEDVVGKRQDRRIVE